MRGLHQFSWPALVAVTSLTALAACRPSAAPDVEENIANELVELPSLPVAEPPVDREHLLIAVARAASAYAAGINNSERDRALGGKRFEIRLRFGCGSATTSTPAGWTFDRKTKTLRLRATPDLSLGDPLVRKLAGNEDLEAVEGFWLERPWLLTDACPASRPSAPEPSIEQDQSPAPESATADERREGPVPQQQAPKVGIAQFFTATDSRTRRRSARPYEAVKPSEQGTELGQAGFNLILSGRLRAGPGGRVISCVADTTDAWPDCIISADIDEVRMERPVTREVIARWEG